MIIKMKKKAQAAMEFLMTYGWAILAAVIAIGVLAYFGVFSPGKYVQPAAVVTPPFYVNAYNVKSTGITLELKNNGGEDYTITEVNIAGCGKYNTPLDIEEGSLKQIEVECSLTSGNNFKGDVTISYKKVGSSVEQTSTGTIAGKVR